MWTKTYADGSVVDIAVSDTHSGPGRSGQRVGTGIWYRIDSGEWARIDYRTTHRLVDALAASESANDLLEYADGR